MSDGLAILEIAMKNSLSQMDSISHNVANANTPAFKSQTTFIDVLQLASPDIKQKPVHQILNSTPGLISQTGNETDLAILGDGYFMVSGENENLLTRNGQLSINERGVLATASGLPIMGQQNEIYLPQEFSVHIDGSVWAGDEEVDRIKVVNVKRDELSPVGSGLYSVSDGTQITVAEDAKIFQGALETSNVNVREELTELVKVMRQIEMQQRLIKAYDQINDVGISTLGEF